jgi:plastocyanin
VKGILAATVAVLLLGGCIGHTGGGPVPRGAVLILIYHMAFRPEVAYARVGQPVTWRFDDAGVLDQVRSTTGAFKSPYADMSTWTHVFSAPGVYRYENSTHTYMVGEVIVSAG